MTSIEQFPVQGAYSQEIFSERLKKYEEVTIEILTMEILLSFWGDDNNNDLITIPMKSLENNLRRIDGINIFLSLRWYPLLLLVYASGISSLAHKKYSNLYKVLHLSIKDPYSEKTFYLKTLFDEMSSIVNEFKSIPGYERNFVPVNEYLYKFLQPIIDDQLYLGSDYETAFDEFEVILALEFAHRNLKESDYIWGPIGRYGWKYRNQLVNNPLLRTIEQVTSQGNSSPIIEAGFFDGSIERFTTISDVIKEQTNSLHWQ